MRPIDADELRETIENHVTTVSCCPTVDWSMGKTQFKKQCLEDIDAAPTIGGWISVKDRKPPAIPGCEKKFREENDPVLLLAGKQSAIYVGWYIGEDYRGIDCYISRTSLNAYQYITRKITHWMPLPSAKEEE